MTSTIDGAGRVVIPKSVREAMGLTPGTPIDIRFADGRIEIEFAPLEVEIVREGRIPTVVPREPVPPMSDDDLRDALEAVRR